MGARRPEGAWLAAGFAVECCLKSVIMRRERLNRWPGPDTAPELWTHDLRGLFQRLGINPLGLNTKDPIAPALKTVLDWRREHGYSVGKVPTKLGEAICEAAFGPNGVVEWLAQLYKLSI